MTFSMMRSNLKEKPNFAKAYMKANEILATSRVIETFPFSSLALVKEQSDIPCRSYAKARKYGVNMYDFGSESAVIMKYGTKAIIFYDETKPKTHINFSILHELGHPINNHIFSSDDNKYGRYEIETNYFAAQLLMPDQLLREFQKRGQRITTPFLMESFGVSELAATKRINTLSKVNCDWYSRDERQYDDIILEKYSSFINSFCPVVDTYNYEEELELQRERDSWY